MKVLIVGAGVAGLTLAHWLDQTEHEVEVIEKSSNMRTEGYMIDFTGTGWAVAERMGIIPAIRQRAYPTEAVIYKDANDKVTAQVHVSKLFERTNVQDKYAALNRRDLVEVLYQHVKDRVSIRFNTTIESIAQDRDGAQVTFSDGTEGDYDLVVGCDGIHSKTRQLVFGNEAQFTHYLGYQFAIFEIDPLAMDLGNSYHMHVEPNMQLGIYPTHADKWLIFSAFAHADSTIPQSKDRVQILKQCIGHLGWHVPQILSQVQDDTYIFWDTITQIQMPQWFNNRVGLIGDSAYCPTLISGQGASMAMAGAYFFSQALERSSHYQEAFQIMDNRLRPHINKIQQSARNFAPTFIPKSQLRIMLINWVLRFANLPLFSGLVGKQLTVDSIL